MSDINNITDELQSIKYPFGLKQWIRDNAHYWFDEDAPIKLLNTVCDDLPTMQATHVFGTLMMIDGKMHLLQYIVNKDGTLTFDGFKAWK
jgi:hypothetical protein